MELTIQLNSAGSAGPLTCRVLERSDIGDRHENQDALGHRRVGDWLVCVLADGAGGHHGGEVAAHQAVNTLLDTFAQTPTEDPAQLVAMVHRVNQGILHTQQSNAQLADMHTTLCAVVVNQRSGHALCVHVGDSRVYHFHNNGVEFKTKDHSVLQWMLDNQQNNHPGSRNALYTALGEPLQHLQVAVSQPFVVLPGDWLLLCSDGLWEHFSDNELALLGSSLRNAPNFLAHMHELALKRAKGQADNLSSLVALIN